MLGMFLRSALPQDHLSDDSKDVMKLGMALVATMSALVLGLLITSAKASYDEQNAELRDVSVKVILLDGRTPPEGDVRESSGFLACLTAYIAVR
jgi:hypothetical protein